MSSQPFNFEKEWSRALQEHKRRLKKPKYLDLIQRADYQSFQQTLIEKDKQYNQRGIAKQLHKLKPALDQFDIFTTAISTLVSSHPEIAGLVWGGTQLLLIAASKFESLLSTISDMIHNLAASITYINRYLSLFPKSAELQRCTKSLIDDYVSFTLSALKYFERWQIYGVVSIFFSTVTQKFKAAKASILDHLNAFRGEHEYLVDSTLVDGTRQLLAALPAATVLPAQPENLYEVPHPQNPNFSGREVELSSLQEIFKKQSRQTSCLLQGMGGIGKTSLAIEYTYRSRMVFDYIFWVDAETSPKLAQEAARLARRLEINPAGEEDVGQRLEAERFRTWLEITERPWLLVFDNAEDWATLKPYWPRSTHGAVLVTSQNAQLGQVTFSTLILKPLLIDAGSKLLLKHLSIAIPPPLVNTGDAGQPPPRDLQTQESNVKVAELISEEVDGLPLAISHVAGALGGLTLTEMLSSLQQRRNDSQMFELDNSESTTQYEKTLGRVWDIALQRLTPESFQLLQVLAMLTAGGIPESLLFGDHEEESLAFLNIPDMVSFNSIITNIKCRQLVDRQQRNGKSVLLIHRMLQRSLLFRMEKNFHEFDSIFKVAFTLVRKVFPKQSPVQAPQNHLWNIWEQYSAQVMSLRSVYEGSRKPPLVSIEFAEMLSDVSEYFWERNMYGDGYRACDTAEEVCEKLGGGFLVERANIHALSGAVRCNHGISQREGCVLRWIKALLLRQEFLEDLSPESATQQDILLYANPWNDIGSALLDYECYEESVTYFAFAWGIKKAMGLDTFSHFPTSELNMAIALSGQQKYRESIALISEATTRVDQNMGADCASAQDVHFARGFILLSAGHFEEAFEEVKGVYERRTQLYGQSSRGTLDACYILATAEQKRGNYQESIDLLEDVMSCPNEWTEESQARAEYRLAVALNKTGQTELAEKYFKSSRNCMKTLLSLHVQDSTLLDSLDQEIIFDHLVSIEAGRSTLGRFQCSNMYQKLDAVCMVLRKRMDSDITKSSTSLCASFQLKNDEVWTAWIAEHEKNKGANRGDKVEQGL